MSIKESLVYNVFKSMRPKQWAKNCFIFGAILFSKNLFNGPMLLKIIGMFFVFSLLSSSVYLVNDVMDREKDRTHPKKKNRPIAAGKVPVWLAITLAIVLLVFSIAISFKFNFYTGIVALIYLVQSTLYTLYFKHVVILDVLLVASGFVLRAIVGGTAIGVTVSVWLLVCITFLALFMPLCRRRHEIVLLSGNAGNHRKILDDYSVLLLDQMISIVTSATLVTYSLYTFLATPNRYLMLTIPFVLYGIFRYLYLVHKKDGGGSPEEIVLKDKPMILNILLWVLTAYIVLYL